MKSFAGKFDGKLWQFMLNFVTNLFTSFFLFEKIRMKITSSTAQKATVEGKQKISILCTEMFPSL